MRNIRSGTVWRIRPLSFEGYRLVAPGVGLVESAALKRFSWGFLRTATEPNTLAHQLRQKGNHNVSEDFPCANLAVSAAVARIPASKALDKLK